MDMLAFNLASMPKVKLVGYIEYTSPWIHFKRKLDEYVLYVIKNGELHMRENGVEYVLRRGDMFLLEPHLEHEGTDKHTCDYYYIHFEHPDCRPAQVDDLTALARRSILEDIDLGDEAMRCYFPKYYTLPDRKSMHQAMHGLQALTQLYRRKQFNRGLTALKFSELLIEWSRVCFLSVLQNPNGKHTKSYMKVHALLDYIHDRYTSRITSIDVEREFECNYDYINRVFKEITGFTITRYVNHVRIRHARELIEATPMSLGEIGYLVGLDDPYYFSKVFKQYVGLSPMQYYKRMREM